MKNHFAAILLLVLALCAQSVVAETLTGGQIAGIVIGSIVFMLALPFLIVAGVVALIVLPWIILFAIILILAFPILLICWPCILIIAIVLFCLFSCAGAVAGGDTK
jgi:hypothetical protein